MKLKAAHFIIAIFIFFGSSAYCLAPKQVSISGTIENPKGKSVYLSKYENYISYEKVTVDSASLDAGGNFTMTFDWKEAGEAMFFHGNEMANLYLIPGNSINLTLNTEEFDETLTFSGNGSAVNNYLAQQLMLKELGKRSRRNRMDIKNYVHLSDSFLEVDKKFKADYVAKHPDLTKEELAFFKEQETSLLYNWAADKLRYPAYHSYLMQLSERIQPEESYYAFLNELETSGEGKPDNQKYIRFSEEYISYLAQKEKLKDTLLKNQPYELLHYNIAKTNFSGKTKAILLGNYLHNAMTHGSGIEVAEPLLADFQKEAKAWPDLLNTVNSAYKKVLPLKAGNPAPDFSAISVTGEKISLSDFKGKVVYLDVWASWCGPCIREIPYAKKLDSVFQGKDVVFLNISLDESEKAWLTALENYEIHGTNAIAEGAFDSELAKTYLINGIPKYLLISKEGKIISSNASRPSGNAAKEIEAALSEQPVSKD